MFIPEFNPLVAEAIINHRLISREPVTEGERNAFRAEGAGIALRAHIMAAVDDAPGDLNTPEQCAEAVHDLLKGLRHFCEAADVDFDAQTRRSEDSHTKEVAAEQREADDRCSRRCRGCNYDVDDTKRWFSKCVECAAF